MQPSSSNQIIFEGDGNDWLRLFSYMIYPNDEPQREKLELQYLIDITLRGKQPNEVIPINASALKLLLDSESIQSSNNEMLLRQGNGTHVGFVLYYHGKLANLKKKASIKKAIWLTEPIVSNLRSSRDIKITAYRDRQIRKFLNEFSSVAHYWAAKATIIYNPGLLSNLPVSEKFCKEGLPQTDNELQFFLPLALWYKNHVKNFSPSHSKTDMSSISADFTTSCDQQMPVLSIDFREFSNQEEKRLAAYRHSSY